VRSSARDSSLKLLPQIAVKTPLRAAQLNLTVSGYVAALVWNQAQAPSRLRREPDSKKFARQRVGCYLRRQVGSLAARLASAAGLSLKAFIEALIARDLRSPESNLTLLPRRGSTKSRL